MRVLVVTTVHHPEDSRVRARQIEAMLAAGWDVTYAASFSDHGLAVPDTDSLRAVDLPRARGRHRGRALLAARRLIRSRGAEHDIVILHDPELLLAAIGLPNTRVVWDVHEDTVASIELKPWLPRPVRRLAGAGVHLLERWAESHVWMLLAEESYQDKYHRTHLVVPNTVRVPAEVSPSGNGWAVYIGALTEARGATELIETGRILARSSAGRVRLRLVGAAPPSIATRLREAQGEGILQWDGFLPSREAMGVLDGAAAGLSLLHDQPNYRISMPTKVLEYMAHGVPVVTTPLPLAERIVTSTGAGLVVPFGGPAATAEAVLRLADDPELRAAMAEAGRAAAGAFDWTNRSIEFLDELSRIAGSPRDALRR